MSQIAIFSYCQLLDVFLLFIGSVVPIVSGLIVVNGQRLVDNSVQVISFTKYLIFT